MTLRFVDSFDHYATADIPLKYTSYSNNNSYSISAGSGRRGAAFASAQSYLIKYIDSQQTWTCGFAFRANSWVTTTNLFQWVDSGTIQMALAINTAGQLYVARAASTQLGSAATTALNLNTYYYIEFKVKISSSVGTVDVHVNGVSVISLTGQNTQNSANATANGFYIGFANSNSQGLFDDLYVCDGNGTVNNTFLGDCRVDCFLPTGNGTNSQFTNNSGNSTNNYTHVNEASQDGDTSYVADLTVGDIDSYAITGLTTTPTSIYGVQTNLIAKKDDAGSRFICPLLYRSATAYAGTGVALSAGSYTDLNQIYEQDPGTSTSWTKTNLNATEFGVKVSA